MKVEVTLCSGGESGESGKSLPIGCVQVKQEVDSSTAYL